MGVVRLVPAQRQQAVSLAAALVGAPASAGGAAALVCIGFEGGASGIGAGVRPSVRVHGRMGVTGARQRGASAEQRGWKRFCAGEPPPGGKDLVEAICLAADKVKELLEQSWVATWQGWEDIANDGCDSAVLGVAQHFLRIAGANVHARMTSNCARLQELAAQGIGLKVAAAHGVNNCLIDSLLLGLMMWMNRHRMAAQRNATTFPFAWEGLLALGVVHLRFTWQARHLVTSTFVLRGRRGTYRTGLGLVTRLGPLGRA